MAERLYQNAVESAHCALPMLYCEINVLRTTACRRTSRLRSVNPAVFNKFYLPRAAFAAHWNSITEATCRTLERRQAAVRIGDNNSRLAVPCSSPFA
jgi:hypothetical protein